MSDKPKLQVRPMRAEAAELDRFAEVFAKNGVDKVKAQLQWQYLRAPEGRVYVDFATPADDEDRIAGIYAAFPLRVKLHGEVREAVQSLDTLTDSDFRGQGLFLKLARGVYDRCREEQVAFVYGFPNDSSAHGFFRYLDWTNLDPVPYLVRPLRTRWLARRLPKVGALAARLPDLPLPRPAVPRLPTSDEIRSFSTFTAEFDDLWADFAQDVHIGVVRDAKFLSWRFASRPKTPYRSLAYYSQGRLEGFVTFLLHTPHDAPVGAVMELIHRSGRVDVGAALLATALDTLASEGAEVALTWNLDTSPNHAAFRKAGFLKPPRSMIPGQLHFGVAALDAPADAALANRDSWYVSYADSDTV